MCRKVAHKASATAGTVASALGDTSVRVADGIVSRMGNSNYGRSAICTTCCLSALQNSQHAPMCLSMLLVPVWQLAKLRALHILTSHCSLAVNLVVWDHSGKGK